MEIDAKPVETNAKILRNREERRGRETRRETRKEKQRGFLVVNTFTAVTIFMNRDIIILYQLINDLTNHRSEIAVL